MTAFLFKILHMSIYGGILILAVLLIRALFAEIPRRLMLVVWVLVIIRLMCPFSVSNSLSPVPSTFFHAEQRVEGTINAGERSDWSTEDIKLSIAQDGPVSEDTIEFVSLLFAVWLVGMAVVLGTAEMKCARIRKSVRDAVCWRENVYLCPHIRDSFVLGLIHPRIYIPSSIGREHLDYIIDHEREHIRQKDHLLKFMFYIAMAVHWFNPLCRLAYARFSGDLEVACDERTLRRRDAKYKADYMQALLDCGSFSASLGMETLSFGRIGMKGRVERIMNERKTGKITLNW